LSDHDVIPFFSSQTPGDRKATSSVMMSYVRSKHSAAGVDKRDRQQRITACYRGVCCVRIKGGTQTAISIHDGILGSSGIAPYILNLSNRWVGPLYPRYPWKRVGRDSSVSIATLYGVDGPGIESRWGRDFPQSSIPPMGPTQPPIQWVPGLFLGGEAAGVWS
jgi:hypothetical protein